MDNTLERANRKILSVRSQNSVCGASSRSFPHLKLSLSDLGKARAASDPAQPSSIRDDKIGRSKLSPRVEQEAGGCLFRRQAGDIIHRVGAVHQGRWRCRGARRLDGIDGGAQLKRLLLLPHRVLTKSALNIRFAVCA